MRVYLAIKFHADCSNRELITTISSVLAECGCETFCVIRDLERWGEVRFSPDILMQQSFAAIDASDALLVELTEKGVGVGIEAGYAFARGIPVFTIAEAGADISETLRGISQATCSYTTYDELTEFLKQTVWTQNHHSSRSIERQS
ncbi:MAG: nucleoside 2-deoxyribosyltransferase [Anaerolineae bacterium]